MEFRFEYEPGAIRYGPNCVTTLGEEVDAQDADRALVVTGRTVGTTDAVEGVRDGLGLPTRLREIDDMNESDLPSIAADVHGDGLMPYCPAGLDPTVDELEAVLSRAR